MCGDHMRICPPQPQNLEISDATDSGFDDKLPTNPVGLNDMHELTSIKPTTRCLEHQLPEDQPSPLGLICRECQARLLQDPPRGSCRAFWESQPTNDSNGEACAVFTLTWDDFQIRSQHPATGWDDLERAAREILASNA